MRAPSAPQEIVYELANPVKVSAVQLHQNPEWPSKDVEVLVSLDGGLWTSVLSGEMPASVSAGPNRAYLLQRDLATNARFVKVRILSGYQTEHWGLGEIEVFGTGAVHQTDDDWYAVTADVKGLEPGASYHFRLVSESDAGVVYGGDKVFVVPDGKQPEVLTGKAIRIRGGSAQLQGRVNPLDNPTAFAFEYGETAAYGIATDTFYAGSLDTPRTVVANVSGLVPGRTYHYRVLAFPDLDRSTKTFPIAYGPDATFVAQ